MLADMPTTTDGGGLDRYDFFISFTDSDREWADWIDALVPEVRNVAGDPCTALYQGTQFVAGTNWVAMVQDGLRRADRFVAVFSDAYLKASSFGAAELHAAWRTDPNGAFRRVVPVRVKDCEPEGLFGPIVYIDLLGLGPQAAERTLVDGLTAAIHGRRPRRRPPFPGASR
ncbi:MULTISPECIES: toll/interleukin-1 receptor domain-containing protein [Catenuloplanes]|uniref:TIR domain-containing protein n=1 Tax=Catenuloplanes niger TaxID=587534 RepID=A0AAE4A0B2_9ACTN|nr:toll/interleukin-1 receptor domain-containing protein [Catenuloplanes niger]MDR7328280.1 hypothetical protein [Catenuloplanes niger]